VEERRPNQTLTGVVVSDKMDKTVVVLVNRQVKHPVYKKYIRRRAKFMAHDEKNVARMGDTVEIVQSRPLSRLKRWRLIKVIASQA
jgi:small subunit ribosomal protein S17